MEISPILMAKMMFFAFAFGICSGIVFDALRALRMLFSNRPRSGRLYRLCDAKLPFSKRKICRDSRVRKIFFSLTVFLSDIFFVLFAFLGIILINYFYNDGGVRGFTVFAGVVGFAVYYFTLSRLLLLVLECIVFVGRYFLEVFFDVFYPLFLNIYNNLVKNIEKIREKFRFRIEKKSEKVYNVCEILYHDSSEGDKRIRINFSRKKKREKGSDENEKK